MSTFVLHLTFFTIFLHLLFTYIFNLALLHLSLFKALVWKPKDYVLTHSSIFYRLLFMVSWLSKFELFTFLF